MKRLYAIAVLMLTGALIAPTSYATAPLVGKKGLIVVTNHGQMGSTGKPTGYFLSEVTHPYWKLVGAGMTVDFVSPDGGPAPMDPSSRDLSDQENKRFVEDSSLMKRLDRTLKPSQIDPSHYSVILYAGGHGTMWDFADDGALAALAARLYENGGIVGAVCHGPAGLLNIKLSDGSDLVKGRKVAAFTNAEEEAVGLTNVVPFLLETELIKRGATVVTASNFTKNVQVDGRLVTGQNPASASDLGTEVVRLLSPTRQP